MPRSLSIRVEDVLSMAEALAPEDRLRLIERLWESMPSGSWPAPSAEDMAAATRRLMDSDVRWMDPVPWLVVRRLIADSIKRSRPKVYSAPRRFDLATIFIVTVAYSLLFALMSVLGLPAGVSLTVAGFITVVGVGQAALFRGEKPRLASAIVGLVIYSVCMLGVWIISGRRIYDASTFVLASAAIAAGGVLLGYVAGACVGAVFMLAEYMRRVLRALIGRTRSPVQEEM